MPSIRFQLLTHLVEIAVEDAAIREHLAYFVPDAEQPAPPEAALRYEVIPQAGGCFALAENGALLDRNLDALDIMPLIYARCHEAVYRALPAHLRVHAGCATLDGRRVLIIGSKGAGKTTLMLRLMFDGVEVQGDERVLVFADGQVVPFPRRFHIRPATLALLPELAAGRFSLPSAATSDGGRLFSFAPSDAGQRWRISRQPVDAVVFLHPSHGQETSIRSVTEEGLIRRLRRQTSFPEQSSEWFGILLQVAGCAAGYLLYNGEPRASAVALRHIFSA